MFDSGIARTPEFAPATEHNRVAPACLRSSLLGFPLDAKSFPNLHGSERSAHYDGVRVPFTLLFTDQEEFISREGILSTYALCAQSCRLMTIFRCWLLFV